MGPQLHVHFLHFQNPQIYTLTTVGRYVSGWKFKFRPVLDQTCMFQ